MGLGPDVQSMADKVAALHAASSDKSRDAFKRRIWQVVRSNSREESRHAGYFHDVQRELSRRGSSVISATANARKRSKKVAQSVAS